MTPEEIERLKALAEHYTRPCGVYLGDNDATCPQLTCIRRRGHEGLHDNVQGDPDDAILLGVKTLIADLERARELVKIIAEDPCRGVGVEGAKCVWCACVTCAARAFLSAQEPRKEQAR